MVDASGPFQAYGDPYRVVRAAIARGIDYLDLADGSDFVKGIAQFDAEREGARRVRPCGRVELSGAHRGGGAPARARHDARRAISGGIAPSPYAGVGLNVIRAIAGYSGKPINARRATARGQSPTG